MHRAKGKALFSTSSAGESGGGLQGRPPADLFLPIATLSLHRFHQLHQPVHEGQLGGQERAHDPHALVALPGEGESVGVERLVSGERAPRAEGSDLEQSLAEPHHDVQVHLGLGVSLLAVLVLALHNHIPAAVSSSTALTDTRPFTKAGVFYLHSTHQYK